MDEQLRRFSQRALSDAWTVSASYWLARQVLDHGIEGDFVECGVFAGAQAAAMGKALIDTGQANRKIHLFDSFTGIPKAGPNDVGMFELLGRGDISETSGVSACSAAQVSEHMREWGLPAQMFRYHQGLFHETVPLFNQPIALLRLDGDLYESTKVCLEHLYPQLAVGGVCTIDDYALGGCRKAVEEYFLANNKQLGPIHFCKSS